LYASKLALAEFKRKNLEVTATVVLKDELRVDVCQITDVAHIVTYMKSKQLHHYARSDVLTVKPIKITVCWTVILCFPH
jgi:hypothetical protein